MTVPSHPEESQPGEPNPPPGHPLHRRDEAELSKIAPRQFKVEVGRPLAPFAPPLLHEATLEQINAELSARHLSPLLNMATLEQINAELTRRFCGVALIGIQVGPDGVVRDMYYTSVRGLPMPALAGCVSKLAADLQSQSSRVDIKPT